MGCKKQGRNANMIFPPLITRDLMHMAGLINCNGLEEDFVFGGYYKQIGVTSKMSYHTYPALLNLACTMLNMWVPYVTLGTTTYV